MKKNNKRNQGLLRLDLRTRYQISHFYCERRYDRERPVRRFSFAWNEEQGLFRPPVNYRARKADNEPEATPNFRNTSGCTARFSSSALPEAVGRPCRPADNC